MSSPGPSDETAIENALRELLSPLDRRLGAVAAPAALALFLGIPAVSLFLCSGLKWDWYICLFVAFLLFLSIAKLKDFIDHRLGLWALRRFDARFPPGSPDRGLAIHILGEMESPNKAEQKLLQYLNRSATGGIIRRRSGTSPEQVLDAALGPSPHPPLNPPPPVAPPPARPSQPGEKAGGYYDYIPLELPPSAGTDDPK
jgi:hypothetical protein